MALVLITTKKDEYGRKQEVYIDTDDLTQEEYHNYLGLINSNKNKEARNYISECLRRK